MRSRIGAHRALFDKIDLLSKTATTLPVITEMDFVRAEICKYCCILTSAAIDLCMEDCLLEYVEEFNDTRTTKYAKGRLSRARNPTVATLCEILGQFDLKWQDELETAADSRIRSDVGSIVYNRNEIAHGRSSTVTFGRLLPWIKSAKTLCDRVEQIIFP
jgi:hypothetical protein